MIRMFGALSGLDGVNRKIEVCIWQTNTAFLNATLIHRCLACIHLLIAAMHVSAGHWWLVEASDDLAKRESKGLWPTIQECARAARGEGGGESKGT